MRTIVSFMTFLFLPAILLAQAPHRHQRPNQKDFTHRVHHYILKTNQVIAHAKKSLIKGGVYTGAYARSLAHQRTAIRLFQKHQTRRALYHSKMARDLAKRVIMVNKQEFFKEWEETPEEKNELKGMPNLSDLENDIHQELGNIEFDDKKALEEDLSDLEVLEMPKENYKAPEK